MENEHILVQVGLGYLKNKSLERLQLMVGAWLKQEPHAPIPHALMALYHLASGQLEEAQAATKQALTLDGACGLAHFAMANIYLAEQKNKEAFISVERAHSLLPKDPHVGLTLAHLQLQQGRSEQATHLLRGLLKTGVSDKTLKLVLAEILMNQDTPHLQEALALLIELCQNHPEMSEAWALQANALRMTGDLAKARKLLEFALILEPDRSDFMMSLTQVLLNQSTETPAALQRALVCAERTFTLTPQDWRPALLYAHVLRIVGKVAESIRVLEVAAQAFPEQPEVLYEQARLMVELGNFAPVTGLVERMRALGLTPQSVGRIEELLAWHKGEWHKAFVLADRLKEDSMNAEERSRCLPAPVQKDQLTGRLLGLTGDSLVNYLVYLRFAQAFKTLSGAELCLAVPPSLAGFMARIPGVDTISTQMGFQAHFFETIQRLPVLIGFQEKDALYNGPYLFANPGALERVSARRRQSTGVCLVVGLSDSADQGILENLRLWCLAQNALVILVHPMATWQQSGSGLEIVNIDPESDIDTLAAWVNLADHVISGDDFLAHLAGGMGKKADVLLPVLHDVFWGGQENSTPWYPALRLHPETFSEGWTGAWKSLQTLLKERTQLA